ncbi:hypothetical protein [Paenibacillus sp. PL2-23]|uniref:hypothetical protein n=1 Tax=Paenibacillus sp. PL2-23 TaxID=2100729 RepID=UPI0030F93B63
MNAREYLNQLVLVTLYDGSKHQGVLKLSGTEPETRRVFFEVHGGGEVYHVPEDDIDKIELAQMLN